MHASERSGLRADHENLELSKMRVIEAGLVLFAQHVQVFRPAFLVVCDLVLYVRMRLPHHLRLASGGASRGLRR